MLLTSHHVQRPWRSRKTTIIVLLVFCLTALAALGSVSVRVASGACAQASPSAHDVSPPEISQVSVYDITATSATFAWSVDEPATGQVEYGRTSAYGSASEKETSFGYCMHIQTIAGLEDGQQYHFRVISEDAAGNRAESADLTFATSASKAASTCTPFAPGERAVAPGSASLQHVSDTIYGTGLNADAKSNRTIAPGRDVVRHAIRWRASTSSNLEAIVVQWRTSLIEPDYSGGDLGTYRITVQTDDGTKVHHPSGEVLSSMTLKMSEIPGIGGEGHKIRRHEFQDPPAIREGDLYHLVFENIDNNPRRNYLAINHLFTFEQLDPRQPMFSNLDLAVLGSQSAQGDQWTEDTRHTPNIDIEYANGVHDGQSYQNTHDEHFALIGGENQARERFTVSGGDREVTSMWVRVNRQSGSQPLSLILEAADGSLIEEHKLPASRHVNTWPLGGQGDTGDWVGVAFETPRELIDGATYCVRLTAPEGTTYSTDSLLSRSDYDINGEYMKSFRFDDGRSEKSTDGGATWESVHPTWADYLDMQFYLTLS